MVTLLKDDPWLMFDREREMREQSPSAAVVDSHSVRPSEQAAFIDSKINSGDYATASEVVRAGPRALRERDEAVEPWLRNEVAASYDAMKANPERAISVDAAFEATRSRHAAKAKDHGRSVTS